MKINPHSFFVDIETTGFSPTKNDIIQLAGIIVKDNEALNSFNQFCRPYYPSNWSLGAERIHGISFNDAMGFQSPRRMVINLMNFLAPYRTKEDPFIEFICHSKNSFDYKFVLDAFIREGLGNSFYNVFKSDRYQSTINLAEKCREITGLENSKLKTLADYFNIELNHHEAMSDVMACFEVYKKLNKLKRGLFQ